MKALLLLLALSAPIFACDLDIKAAPELRGLRLGMTESAVIARFGKNFPKGLSPAELSAITLSNEVRDISIYYLENRLAFFVIYYDRSLQWNGAMELAEQVSKYVPALPVDSWHKKHRDLVDMQCRDFYVSISTLSNSIAFTARADVFSSRSTDWQRKERFKP